ncbi:hypothetical protein BJ170DRAFT_260045 [Xylariales sp. AK1849]|nr:hypothetical protein BJ170DRAFT_260045 [Xylariales sp. AK1849]
MTVTKPPVRTVPPWVLQYCPDDIGDSSAQAALRQIDIPQPAAHPPKPPQNGLQRRVSKDGYEDWVDEKYMRTSKLPPILRKRADKPGRRWDHLRSAEPVIMGTGYRAPGADPYAQWRDFIHSSTYGWLPGQEHEVVSNDYLHQLQPGLDNEVQAPYHPRDPKSKSVSRKQRFMSRLWNTMLRHPIVPLIFRLLVLATSIAALAVSVNILNSERAEQMEADSDDTETRRAEINQAIMAIIVDTIAIPYIIYMTWDEFTGKPLGLRPPLQKISLTLLDLIFIIFKSASTALAFQALVSRRSSSDNGTALTLHLARSLSALMVVGLAAWVSNFTISVFRLVERLGGVDDGHGSTGKLLRQ